MIQAFYRNSFSASRCRRLTAILGLAASLLGAPAAAQQAPQQPQQGQPGQPAPRSQVFGDWTTICRARPEGGENCVMGQTVTNQSEGEARPIMEVVVGRLQDGGGFGMRITLPLGITLAGGATVGVDQNNPDQYAFQRCIPTGCQIDILLDEARVAQLQRGAQGSITFRDFSGQPVTLPFSLSGFTAAFNLVAS